MNAIARILWITTLIPTLLSTSALAAEVAVRFELDFSKSPSRPIQGLLTLRSPETESTTLEIPLLADGTAVAKLPRGSVWEAQVTTPGLWVRRELFRVDPATPEVSPSKPLVISLKTWPLGQIEGRLVLPRDPAGAPPALPRRVIVTTLPARSSATQQPPRGEIECPTDHDGRFRCELPAASYDLSLFVQGFVPHYRWDLTAETARVVDVGTLQLKRGASLAGWVRSEGGAGSGPELSQTRIEIIPATAVGGGDLATAEKLARAARQGRVNERGFFQVSDLAAGTYTITASNGPAASRPRGPIEVQVGDETYLEEPLTLEAPMALAWRIEPPLDALGRPWSVQVERFVRLGSTESESAFRGHATESGEIPIPPQRQGRFQITILDSLGQRMKTESDLVLSEADSVQRRFEVDWIDLEGEIRADEAPLRAELWFGGRQGGESIHLESDADGKFRGILPREGHWTIDVMAADRTLAVQLLRRIEAREGRARITVEIPRTRVFGRVIDAAGHPLAGAEVGLTEPGGAYQSLTADSEGRFEFRGSSPGTAAVEAESADRTLQASVREIEVSEGEDLGPIEIVAMSGRAIVGRVLSSRGEVSGAVVSVHGARPSRFGFTRARTTSRGAFEVRLPAVTESAVAVVSAPGLALTAFELKPGPTRSDLFVSDLAGTVEVELDPDWASRLATGELSLVTEQNGLELPSFSLTAWSRTLGDDLGTGALRRFSGLATGDYRVCLTPSSRSLQLLQRGWSSDLALECRSGRLAPADTLRLALTATRNEQNKDTNPTP